jgi:hypothetical protein
VLINAEDPSQRTYFMNLKKQTLVGISASFPGEFSQNFNLKNMI